MAEAWKKLYQGEVPDEATLLYTAPASTEAIIKYIVGINSTGSAYDLTLWQGGSADVNLIFGPSPVPIGGRVEFNGNILMEAADTLYGLAGAASAITLTAYGLEVS